MGQITRHSMIVTLLSVALWVIVTVRPASAATIVVDGVTCTLADAITAANTDTATGGCPAGSGADTLDLVADITLTNRLPAIVSELTLMGNGHTVSRLPGAPAFRILEVGWYGIATIDGITLTGGVDDGGGGILNQARLAIINSTISGNTAASGGGIRCYMCFMSISGSVVSNNTASFAGGGLDLYWELPTERDEVVGHLSSADPKGRGGWYVQITDSAIAGNSAQAGGGLRFHGVDALLKRTTINGNVAVIGGALVNYRAGASIESSTLSGNTATEKGGAIYNESFALEPLTANVPQHYFTLTDFEIPEYGGVIELSNSTVAYNTAPLGAGLFNKHVGPPFPQFIGAVRPSNSIVAVQAGGEDCVSEGGAVVESQGYNIESSTSCGFAATGDQQNVTAAELNLAPLTDNGGPTWTHALTPGSAAIDKGSCPNVSIDQRGYPRPVDIPGVPNAADGCDVGAFETETPLAVTVAAFDAVDQASNWPLPRLVVAFLIASLLLAKRLKRGRIIVA